ncbi:MAG: hypothetical protein VZS44_00265 [Bacilli bacterium]|nr:hypothetical protein [Bacilli bacterium]
MVRKCLLFLSLFMLCGCTANYDLKIDSKKVEEKLSINNVDVSDFKGVNLPISGDADDANVFEKKNADEKYYDKKIGNGDVSFSYKHTIGNFSNSYILNSCYDKVDAFVYKNKFILSTTGKFNCFELYDQVDSVKVSINSQYELIDTNASKINGFNYEWNINKNNLKDGIYIELDLTKRKKSFKEIFGSDFLRVLFFGGVIVVCFILYLIFKAISMAKDKI